MSEIFLYKKGKREVDSISVGMAYPSAYIYGMSVIGYLFIFKEFDENPNVQACRIFKDSDSSVIKPNKLNLLGFSFVFEQDILEILKMLKKYNINLLSKNRKSSYPLVFAGGPVITNNPEPFADFFDFMIIGDGEKVASEITQTYIKYKNGTKEQILEGLSQIEGIYVPSLYKIKYEKEKIKQFFPIKNNLPRYIQKRTTADTKNCLYSPIISDKAFYSDTAFIEISRGCPYACKFCAAHYQNTPVRYFDIKEIIKAVKFVSKYAKKITFIGAMISAHPNFNELCLYLKKIKQKKNIQIEFSAMSFDYHSKHISEIIDDKQISVAIECGSASLRKKAGKDISNEKIYETISFYSRQGIEKFNLYFLLGLPDETMDDIDEYIDFSLNLQKNFPIIKFTHIISTFIPKAGTPFERKKRFSNAKLKERIEKIKKFFKENKITAYYPMPERDSFNALISLGDRRICGYLKYLAENNIELKEFFKAYKKYMSAEKKHTTTEIPHYSKFIYREKTKDEILPWDFIKL